MNPSRSALLQHLRSEISTKRKARFTESGFLGPPPELYWDNPSYLPFVRRSFGNGSMYAYPARIIHSPPDDADESAAIALCSAILRAEDYEAEIKKAGKALCNRLLVGSRLDPGAMADVVRATRAQMHLRALVEHGGDETRKIEDVEKLFVEGMASAAQDLFLDQWEDASSGEVNLNVLRNVSTFYARLRCLGFVDDDDFDEALGMILDECTETTLALLIVAVVDLMSPATMSSIRKPIAAENWRTAQQQLNEIEGRAHEIRGQQLEDDIVALLCGVMPTEDGHVEEANCVESDGDTDLEEVDSTFTTSGDPDFDVYISAIYDLRDFLTDLQDADEAPPKDTYTTRLPCVAYCRDPPPVGTRKWRYLKALCKDIQKWAANTAGLGEEITWRANITTLQVEADCEVVDPDVEIHERGIDFGQWVTFHRTCDVLEGYYSEEEEGGEISDEREEEEEEIIGVHVDGNCYCRQCRSQRNRFMERLGLVRTKGVGLPSRY